MKHSKRQLIDNSLFAYGGFVAIVLTYFAFLNLNSPSSALSLILFLPVSLYFLVKIGFSLGKLIHRTINYDQKRHPYFGSFSLATFLNQTETSFLINLTLIALAITVIIFKISLNLIK